MRFVGCAHFPENDLMSFGFTMTPTVVSYAQVFVSSVSFKVAKPGRCRGSLGVGWHQSVVLPLSFSAFLQ